MPTPAREPGRRPRLALLIAIPILAPALISGVFAASDDRVEVAGQRGSYVYTPICTDRLLQVRHSEGQVRWRHRGPPEALLQSTFSVQLDAYGSVNRHEPADGGPFVLINERWALGRLQLGFDWTYIGLRWGAAGGARWTERFENNGGVRRSNKSTSALFLPAGSLRIGTQALHLRGAISDGTWQMRPGDVSLGVGFGSGFAHPQAELPLRAFIGFGNDLRDASADGFACVGVRSDMGPVGVGALGRFGPDGWALGMMLSRSL